MYKYIITWVLYTVVQVPPPNQINEFGMESNTTLAILYTKTIEEIRTKEFVVKDSAFAFYKRGLERVNNSGFYGLGSKITKIDIDSILDKK